MHKTSRSYGESGSDATCELRGTAGKRTRTEGLAVQRKASGARPAAAGAAEEAAAPASERSWQSGFVDDPFGFGTRPSVQARGGAIDGEGPGAIATAEQGVAGASASLPFADSIQRAFGRHDVGNVRAQLGGAGADAASALGARAYAVGDRVAFAGGPDLHTAAHEAAHVVQQRAGVHLKDGVGQAGDVYERHADAVADRVVAGQSAEELLDQHAGAPAGGGVQRAVQRASDYDGLLPAHETYKDSYQMGGEKKTDFTYHHIIPENRLVEVTAELKAIKAYFDTLQPSDENAELRGKNDTLNTGTGGLITTAKAGWQNTRIKNVTHLINSTYDNLGVAVAESDVRELIEGTAANLNALFAAFVPVIKRKVQAHHSKATTGLRRAVVEALNDAHVYNAVNNGDAATVAAKLAGLVDKVCFDRGYLDQQVPLALTALRQEQKKGQLNKSTCASTIEGKLRERDFDAFYRDECGPLYVDSLGNPRNLKKLLQGDALPGDDSNDLKHAVQWNPGNIHRGPSSSKRLNPDDEGFVAKLDDGGNTFETAAFNVVSPAQFVKLNALKTAIDQLLATKVTPELPPDSAKVDKAAEVVGKMKELMGFGLTQFNASQWDKVEGKDKMRLRLDQGREAKAQENGLIA